MVFVDTIAPFNSDDGIVRDGELLPGSGPLDAGAGLPAEPDLKVLENKRLPLLLKLIPAKTMPCG